MGSTKALTCVGRGEIRGEEKGGSNPDIQDSTRLRWDVVKRAKEPKSLLMLEILKETNRKATFFFPFTPFLLPKKNRTFNGTRGSEKRGKRSGQGHNREFKGRKNELKKKNKEIFKCWRKCFDDGKGKGKVLSEKNELKSERW